MHVKSSRLLGSNDSREAKYNCLTKADTATPLISYLQIGFYFLGYQACLHWKGVSQLPVSTVPLPFEKDLTTQTQSLLNHVLFDISCHCMQGMTIVVRSVGSWLVICRWLRDLYQPVVVLAR